MDAAHKTILIADDDRDIVEALSAILNFNGYDVLHVYDGTSVLDAVKGQPHLVLLDLAMPGHDGATVCKQLKRQASTQNIPVILVSAEMNLAKTAKQCGADDFIEKPFDMDVLQEKISALLNSI